MAANPDRKHRARSSSSLVANEAFLCAHCGNTVPAEAVGEASRRFWM